MDDSQKKNQDAERLCLIDFSSEDDCLFASPSGSLRDLQISGFTEYQKEHDCFEARSGQEGEDAADLIGQKEQAQLSEPEGTRKIGKCNLRKSLAWDSAFFTNAGVLDPEELSIINNGFKKAETHPLPGILEDVRRSVESNSTLDSDTLTLESLEIDLFEDIRASIQKSSKASNVACSSSKSGPKEPGTQSLRSSKKIDQASRIRMKPVPVSKRQSLSMQGSGKTIMEASVRPRTVKPGTRTGEPNASFLKPPRIAGRAIPISAAPAKRTSMGATRIKVEHNTAKAASGKGGLGLSKKPGLGDSSSVTSRSTPSPKSSSGSSPSTTKMESTASCSSNNKSGSTSSDSTGKSPLDSRRNKTNSRNLNPASSGSTHTTPLRNPSRNKTEPGNSRLSAYLMSMSKPSSISPATSIDGWSSESSSSTSTVNQRSTNSKTSSSSRRGVSLDRDAPQALDLQIHPQDQPSFRRESRGAELASHCATKLSKGTGAVSHSATTDVSRSIKPSGLRMPSPKIGFFDAEKSLMSTPKGGSQFQNGVHSGLPKNGPGVGNLNSGGAIKTKPGKIQPARTISGTGNMKFDHQQAGVLSPTSSIKPTSLAKFQELSNASPKVSAISRTIEENHSKMLEVLVPDEEKWDLGSGLDVEEKGGQAAFKNKIEIENDGQVLLRAFKISPPKEHGPYISCEKENIYNIEDQVDSLSRHMGVIDINTDVKEVMGKDCSHSPVDVDNPDSVPKLLHFNSRELVIGQDDILKLPSKSNTLSLSPTTFNVIPNTRIPFSVKDSFCNRSGLFEPVTDSTIDVVVEKTSVFSFPEGMLKENT